VLGKGAHAALAQNDIVVTFRHDVLSGQEPFIQGGGQPALEQDRQRRSAHSAQQGKVLHVSSANLDHVTVTFDQIHTSFIKCFRNNLQAVNLTDLSENLQSFF